MKNLIAAMLSTALSCAAFLFLFLFLHWNPAVAAVLSVLLYFAFGLLLKPRKKLGGIDIEKIQGGEELQRLLNEARKDLKQIGKAARAITNIKAREDAEALESCGKRILAYLQENPEKISMARRFFTYYLDTAAGLLERYIQMQETGLRTPEISEAMMKTARTLPVLNEVFDRQFTRFMEGELMDVDAEISLLKNTLEMEGGR